MRWYEIKLCKAKIDQITFKSHLVEIKKGNKRKKDLKRGKKNKTKKTLLNFMIIIL